MPLPELDSNAENPYHERLKRFCGRSNVLYRRLYLLRHFWSHFLDPVSRAGMRDHELHQLLFSLGPRRLITAGNDIGTAHLLGHQTSFSGERSADPPDCLASRFPI